MNAPALLKTPGQLELDDQDGMKAWAAERIANMFGEPFPATASACGVTIAGALAAVVVFSDWRPRWRTMQVSVAAADPRWLRARGATDWIFNYAFGACDVQKLWTVTPARNARAIKICRGLGFDQEAVLERHFGDDDAVLSRQFRETYYSRRRACLR